ncbi:hypothetical protein CR513_46279, partial [Mucuna pruriens]
MFEGCISFPEYRLILNFLYAYSRYNQIHIFRYNKDKTTFINDYLNFCYKVMSFGLKNTRATYQRLMDKIFAKLGVTKSHMVGFFHNEEYKAFNVVVVGCEFSLLNPKFGHRDNLGRISQGHLVLVVLLYKAEKMQIQKCRLQTDSARKRISSLLIVVPINP